MRKILCLCESRHEMPECVEGAIYSNTLNPLDIDGMKKTAKEILQDVDDLTLYVTGLSVALASVITVCMEYDIALKLMHFDRDTNNYYPQIVIPNNRCAFCGNIFPIYVNYCPHCGSN